MQREAERRSVRLVVSGGAEHLSVKGVRAELTLDGPLLHSTLDITFVNDLGKVVEGDLVFPLPPAAALRDLTVRCGDRELAGRIRPRERAQAEYARAIAAGQTAALGESEGEDLLRLRVAPIAVNEEVVASLRIVSRLLPTADGHRLLLPLTYMPRYVEDEAALKDIERAALDRPRPLTLAARADVTITVRHGDAGKPRLRCPSTLRTETLPGETVARIGPVPLDRDMQLDITEPRSDGRKAGALPVLWLRHDPGPGPDGLGSATAVAVLPPAYADEGPTTPRTVTLLVDRSGSMGGAPMEAAIRAVRGCLRALAPTDRFNIIAFDDKLEALAPRPVPFADHTLSAADAFIGGIGARGGTEASKAISAALHDELPKGVQCALPKAERPAADHRLRVVVFMSDGDVAGSEGVLKQAKAELVDTRLHVIGIGESVQHALLSQLATLGGGTYTPVATSEDLEKALARLKAAIDAPLWTGVKVAVEADGQVVTPQHLEPAGRLDLYAGQPLLMAWRGGAEPTLAVSRWQQGGAPYREAPQPGEVRLRLTGQGAEGEDLRLFARLPAADNRADEAGGAMTLWALLRGQRLTYRYEAADDEALEALGVDFGMVNRKVALVAVDKEQRDLEVEGSVAVSLPLPRNVATPVVGGTVAAQGSPSASTGAVLSRARAMAPAPSMTMAGGYAGPPPGARPSLSAPHLMASASVAMDLSASLSEEEMLAPEADDRADRGVSREMEAPKKAKKGIGSVLRDLFSSSAGKSAEPAAQSAPPKPVSRPQPAKAEARAEATPASAPLLPGAQDDEATLRALLLSQGADGLFQGDVGATLAAVAVLVGRGHSPREGLFRAELRRTAAALRQALAEGLTGDAQLQAALALALLTMPGGEEPPAELTPEIAAGLAGINLMDLRDAQARVKAALRAVSSWQGHPLAQALIPVFLS